MIRHCAIDNVYGSLDIHRDQIGAHNLVNLHRIRTLTDTHNLADDISVLNADNKAAPVAPGKEPGKQGRPDIAHMGKACRTRRKPNSN